MSNIYTPPQKTWGERNNGLSYKPKRNGTNLMMIVVCSIFVVLAALMVIYG